MRKGVVGLVVKYPAKFANGSLCGSFISSIISLISFPLLNS